MPETFTARLAPRQSALLWLLTMILAAAAVASLAALASAIGSFVTWCRDFVVAASAGRGAAAIVIAAVLAAAATASVARVIAFVVRESVASRRLARAIARKSVHASGRVAAASDAARGIACVTVEEREPYAATVGIITPRIVISTGLVSALTLSELRAVIAHEAHHARRRHPLRAVLWEAFRRGMFFLPSIGDVARHFALSRELDADRAAVTACGGSRALASALLKAVAPVHLPSGVAAFGNLKPRIEALGGARGTAFIMSVPRASATVAFVSFVVLSLAGTGISPVSAADGATGSCAAAETQPAMSAVNFSPYFSILVPQMSRAEAVQSTEVRP